MAAIVVNRVFPRQFRQLSINKWICKTSSRKLSYSAKLMSAERFFTKKHEWVTIDQKVGTVGISNYAQDQLGDVVYAQMPEVGDEFEMDDEVGALESVKAASEIFTPLSGKIVESNQALEDEPGLINKSCYDKGWLFKIELSKTDEISELMSEDTYNSFLKEAEDH